MYIQRISNTFLSLAEKKPSVFNHPKVIPAVEKKVLNYLKVQKIDVNDPKNSIKITSQMGGHFFLKVIQTACEFGFLGFSADLLISSCIRPLPYLILTKSGLLLGSILAIATHTAPYLHVHAKIQAELPPLPLPLKPVIHRPHVKLIKSKRL